MAGRHGASSPPLLPPGYVWRATPRESIIDPADLATRLADVPAERPTVQGDLELARALRDELVALGGRPTREIKTIPRDPINPEYESTEMFATALDEYSYWGDQLYLWKRFVRWRRWVSDGRPKDVILELQEALPPDPPIDAYPLHIEFRAYLLSQTARAARSSLRSGLLQRARLDSLEEQLAQMRAERGLPPDDNPPPPALVAMRAAEAAKEAADLARIQKIGPRHIIRPPSPESPPPPPRTRKRKRERGGDKTTAEATGDAADEAAAEAAGDVKERGSGAGQPEKRPPAKRRASRRAAAVTETPPPRRSTRIAVLPRKNYKV